MAGNLKLIDELAEAVIDGTPVDWKAAASDVSAGRLVSHLRIVAAVAQVHRTSPLPPTGPAPPTIPSPAVPEMWGHLKILERIGRGAFGDVYRAWDSRLDREVALKLIPAAAPDDEGLPSSIIREGRLLARVRHPNVAMIHGAEQIGDRIGLWTEMIRGRTLEASLGAGSAFTPTQVIQVGVELARAVAAVHAAGLLHRDIKAQNVMQAEDGRIVLMDFGTGREFVDEGTDLAGTPLYLAPEVLSGEPASVQSDIYSLGVLLYHLLTNSYPVSGRTVGEVRRAHEQHNRIDLRTARPDVPVRLARVIEKAIDPVPSGRYPSAEVLRLELDKLAPRRRGRWLGYIAAAVVGIALVSAARVFVAGERALSSTVLPVVQPPVIAALPLQNLSSEKDSQHVVDGPAARTIVASERALSSTVLPVGQSPVIAVLPFQNLGSEQDSQLIVDGLTSEIAHRLGAIEGLSVRAATVSLASGGANADIAALGRELNVNLVLTGSVLVSNGRVRVNAALIRVADRLIVWSDTVTGGPAMAAHDAISLSIVNRLRLKVGQGQRRYQGDADVELMFLKAQGLLARRNTDNADLAAGLFEQIVAREPEYAPAWAGLASAIGAFSMATRSDSLPPSDPRMDEAVFEANRIDPLLAEAKSALGSLRARDRQWLSAEAAFREAIRLNPSLTTTYTEFVLWVLQPMGRQDEALQVLKDAQAANPFSLDVRRVMALVQVDSGLYEDAILSARGVLEIDPEFPFAKLWLARALALSGLARSLPDRVNEAQAIFESNPKGFGYIGWLNAVTGRRAEAEELAAANSEPRGRMLIYAGLGDKDRAFEALETVAGMNPWRAAEWMHRPEMALLRGDPRLDALKVRLGLPR